MIDIESDFTDQKVVPFVLALYVNKVQKCFDSGGTAWGPSRRGQLTCRLAESTWLAVSWLRCAAIVLQVIRRSDGGGPGL